MRNALIAFLVLVSTSFCCPAYGQEITTEYNTTETKEDFTKFLPNGLDADFVELVNNYECTTTMYCNGTNVNVRELPSTGSQILGQLNFNTSVEVIASYKNWSCIGTSNGVAFVYSPYLSESEQTQKLIGTFKITHYCIEEYKHICGNGKKITAMGTPVREGVVSVDPRLIPLGSKVMINGKIYYAEDTGSMVKGNIIDMAVDTHQHALELGVYKAEVYLLMD